MTSSSRPPASSVQVRARMARQASRDTAPEILLRRELHRRGLRYRVHTRPAADLRVTADILFTKARMAVFVDGCFWHRCPQHGTLPRSNGAWWAVKLDANVTRDRRADDELARRGWAVVRIWEHTPTGDAADLVLAALTNNGAGSGPPTTSRS